MLECFSLLPGCDTTASDTDVCAGNNCPGKAFGTPALCRFPFAPSNVPTHGVTRVPWLGQAGARHPFALSGVLQHGRCLCWGCWGSWISHHALAPCSNPSTPSRVNTVFSPGNLHHATPMLAASGRHREEHTRAALASLALPLQPSHSLLRHARHFASALVLRFRLQRSGRSGGEEGFLADSLPRGCTASGALIEDISFPLSKQMPRNRALLVVCLALV